MSKKIKVELPTDAKDLEANVLYCNKTESGEEYNVFFNADTISKIQEKITDGEEIDLQSTFPQSLNNIEVGSVEYNAKNVNEVNPFNPIGHNDVEEPKEVKAPVKKAGRKAKGK